MIVERKSIVEEQIRKKYEKEAIRQEEKMRDEMKNSLLSFENKYTPPFQYFIGGGGALGVILIFSIGFKGLLIGLGCGLAAWGAVYWKYKQYNKTMADARQKFKENALSEIQDMLDEYKRKTENDIMAYRNAVTNYCKKALVNKASLKPMVDQTVLMLDRMISHTDMRPHIKIIETDFNYKVTKTGIQYIYNSTYSNKQDDFDFNIQRFSYLNTDAECEGLAQAIARLIIPEVKAKYGAGARLTLKSRIDADVILHFAMPNKNYQTATRVF